jgi:hypothetical protein
LWCVESLCQREFPIGSVAGKGCSIGDLLPRLDAAGFIVLCVERVQRAWATDIFGWLIETGILNGQDHAVIRCPDETYWSNGVKCDTNPLEETDCFFAIVEAQWMESAIKDRLSAWRDGMSIS